MIDCDTYLVNLPERGSIRVTDLTTEELRQELCVAIDMVERLMDDRDEIMKILQK